MRCSLLCNKEQAEFSDDCGKYCHSLTRGDLTVMLPNRIQKSEQYELSSDVKSTLPFPVLLFLPQVVSSSAFLVFYI